MRSVWVERCSDNDLPSVIVKALEHISEDLPNELSNDDEDEGNDAEDEPAASLD